MKDLTTARKIFIEKDNYIKPNHSQALIYNIEK